MLVHISPLYEAQIRLRHVRAPLFHIAGRIAILGAVYTFCSLLQAGRKTYSLKFILEIPEINTH
jgi:hypothetical protein